MRLQLKYRTPDLSRLFADSLVGEVCRTTAFRRLRGISFLGAIDWQVPFRSNRFDHSIGVALLAQQYANLMGLSPFERRHVVLAALLHDVGHAPLSHSLEPLFRERFGIDHHIATEQVLNGSVRLGKSLNKLLSENEICIDTLVRLMSGAEKSDAGRIFSSPVNADTIEAIWRGLSYVNPTRIGSDPMDVVNALVSLDKGATDVLDRFWESKDYFYWTVIYSPLGASTDYLARKSVERFADELAVENFFDSERTFLSKFRILWQPTSPLEELQIKARRFSVNRNIALSRPENLYQRFGVSKVIENIRFGTHTQPTGQISFAFLNS